MKIGIIAANNIRFSPYINYYTNILDEIGVNYELVFPNRSNVKDSYAGDYKELAWKKYKLTALSYVEYVKKVKKVVSASKYDFLVILTGNNAAFLANWLRKNYKGKYIVDIRDYTHENLIPYFWLEKIAVTNSRMNVISSSKFKDFLPKSTYYTCHNVSSDVLPMSPAKAVDHINKMKLVIGYIGKGGYIDQLKNLCELVKGDKRFEVHIYGLEHIPIQLQEYAGLERFRFFGRFLPEEKTSIIQSIDILFNIYGYGMPLLDYALSNKLYDAFVYKKPILTSPNTYMSEMAGPLGFDVDFEKDVAILDRLYEWYKNQDNVEIDRYSSSILELIKKENDDTRAKVIECVTSSLGEI